MDLQPVCKNCGSTLAGNYCSNCGQKVYTDKDKSFAHFLHETVHFFSHLDNKYLKTLWLIFRHPGKVSSDYTNGIRIRYFNPFSIFFIGVVIYLLLSYLPGYRLEGLNMKLHNYKSTFTGFNLNSVINGKMDARNISFHELEKIYNSTSSFIAKPTLLIILPLSGILYSLLAWKRKKFFYDHLVIGTEACVFYLYLTFFFMPVLLFIPAVVGQLIGVDPSKVFDDQVTFPLYMITFITWLSLAVRKFYSYPWWKSVLLAIIFSILHAIIIYIVYRLILFYLVMLFI